MGDSIWLPRHSSQQPPLPQTGQWPPGPAAPMVIDLTEGTEAVGPLEYLRILYRRRGTLGLVMLLGTLLALLVSLLQPRIYQSTASLEIQGVNDNFLNLRDLQPTTPTPDTRSNETYVETQAEILKQDWLIEQVVKKLQLEQRPEYTRRHLSGTDATQYAVKIAKEDLKVMPSRQSQIVRISYDSPDRQLAADFANTLAQTFIDQSVEARFRDAQQIREWLRPQLEDLRTKLEKSQTALQAYSSASGLVFNPDQDNLSAERLRTLEAEVSKAQSDRIAQQPLYERAAAGSMEGLIENSIIQDYQMKLTDLRRQLADLESLLKPENYKIVRLKAQIAALESALNKEVASARKRIRDEYEGAQSREKLLAAATARQRAIVSDLSAKMIHYNTLKHQVDTTRQIYEAMLQKVNEAGIASAIRPSNIRIVGPAKPALIPYKPNLSLNLSISVFASFILAVGCVMLWEQGDRRLCAPGDAGTLLKLPELGAIPAAKSLESPAARLLLSRKAEGPVELVTWEQRFSSLSESFRSVVISILSSAHNGHSPRVVVITSPLPGEGKTTVTSNLGVTLAEIDRRVLLIDGDLRRPRLHKVFDLVNSWGLSSLLRERETVLELPVEGLVKKTSIPNLWVLPSGPGPDRIFSLLCSERLHQLLSRFRQEFDFVLVDAPPSLEFADARILAHCADGVFVVLRADHGSRKTAMAAVQRLLLDRVQVLGTILNDWDPRFSSAYGYRGYHTVYDSKEVGPQRRLAHGA